MYCPLAVHLDYDPPIPNTTTPVTTTSDCVLSHNGFLGRSDLIQTVCQLYDVVQGERVHSRKTALIQYGSPLHPYSVCNPNYGGHEFCLPLAVDYVSSDFAPPTMAHHFYYFHIRDAKIPTSLKNDIYRQLYHTSPFDLLSKYAELRNRFDLVPLKKCRPLMLAILNFWIQRCKLLKMCLDATEFFPIRLQWTDSVFEGTRLERDQLSQKWEIGRKVCEYGWAIEMVRAERIPAFAENCPLIFVGDNTSTRLARYIEWGKRMSEIDGRFLQQFGIDSWKLEEFERLSTLFLFLQKIHFGNGCIAIVLSSGAHELAEGMAPSKYGKLLEDILLYLLQFQLRILVIPPTPRAENQFLWFQYVQQQIELSVKLSTVEFLIRPTHQANDRCFLDALIIGSRTLDSFMCDDAGFTDFGIKKLGFFLIEVMQIPRTGYNGQISKHEMTTATNSRQDGTIFTHGYHRETTADVNQRSLSVKSYSGSTIVGNLLMPFATSIQNSRYRKKKKKISKASHLQTTNNELLLEKEQHAVIHSAKKLRQSPKLLHGNCFMLSQGRDRRRQARARRASEQLNN
uniref:Uncharacterized protein n=1 Tax=Wuchereria bancrofti TaxID=6293 RepID=A0A1I8EIA4_WUCBA